MHYAFQISAATKAKAKKAVEAKLAAEGFQQDRDRGLAVASAHIDALPDPGTGEELLVVLNATVVTRGDDGGPVDVGGGLATASRRITEVSTGCSAYLVPKSDDGIVDDTPAEAAESAGAETGAGADADATQA